MMSPECLRARRSLFSAEQRRAIFSWSDYSPFSNAAQGINTEGKNPAEDSCAGGVFPLDRKGQNG
jgi:hypothetical protein